MQEATNEHDYDVDEFGAESWTEILEARDWKSLENEWANNGGMSASAEPVKPEEGAEGEGCRQRVRRSLSKSLRCP